MSVGATAPTGVESIVADLLEEAPQQGDPLGAHVVLFIDDHHLLSGSETSALDRLAPIVRQMSRTLHIVLTRRVAGFNRAAHGPLLHALREVRAPTLVMGADPGEGRLWGLVDAGAHPPGRGRLVHGPDISPMQIANFESDTVGATR